MTGPFLLVGFLLELWCQLSQQFDTTFKTSHEVWWFEIRNLPFPIYSLVSYITDGRIVRWWWLWYKFYCKCSNIWLLVSIHIDKELFLSFLLDFWHLCLKVGSLATTIHKYAYMKPSSSIFFFSKSVLHRSPFLVGKSLDFDDQADIICYSMFRCLIIGQIFFYLLRNFYVYIWNNWAGFVSDSIE